MADEETNPPGDEPELDEQDQDDLDGDQDGDDAPADEDPKAVQEERDKLRRTLERIKADRTKARQELKALKAGTLKDGDDPKPDPDARAKRQAGVAALLAEGLSKDQAKTAVRLLDLSDVELDDDGDADLEDQVEDLKSKFPNLFVKPGKTKGGTPAPRTRTAPVPSPASRGGGRPAPRTSGGQRDSVTEKLLKQAGYLR